MLLYYLGKKTTGGELFHRISIVSIDTKPEFYIDVGVTHYLWKRVFFLQATWVPWEVVQRLTFQAPSHLRESGHKSKKLFDLWWEKVEQYYLSRK